jgi:hypothetical protein
MNLQDRAWDVLGFVVVWGITLGIIGGLAWTGVKTQDPLMLVTGLVLGVWLVGEILAGGLKGRRQ